MYLPVVNLTVVYYSNQIKELLTGINADPKSD